MTLWTAAFVVCSLWMFVFPWGLTMGLAIWATFFAISVASALLARLLPQAARADERGRLKSSGESSLDSEVVTTCFGIAYMDVGDFGLREQFVDASIDVAG